MKRKLILGLTVLLTSFFLAPSTGQAVIISTVSVEFTNTSAPSSGGCPITPCTWGSGGNASGNSQLLATWQLGVPDTLGSGQSLLLAQSGSIPPASGGPPGGYNFDTSDIAHSCTPTLPGCTAIVRVNGTAFADTTGVLTALPLASTFAPHPIPDDGSTRDINEAQGYTQIGFVPGANGFTVFVGYADNVHSNACADTDTIPGNCLPDPFGATFVRGFGNFNATAIVESQPFHCVAPVSGTGPADCFDSGVILIVANNVVKTPEPSSLLLLGVGLLGVAAWGRRRLSWKN